MYAHCRRIVLLAAVVEFGCGPSTASDGDGRSSDADGSTTATTANTATTFTTSTMSATSVDSSSSTDQMETSTGGSETGTACVPEMLMGSCSVLCQDCDPDEKCSLVDVDESVEWDEVTCVPLDPRPAGVGEACATLEEGADTCAMGSACGPFGADGASNACVEICVPAAEYECSDPAARCLWLTNRELEGYGYCLRACDPLAVDACIDSEVCQPYHPSCSWTSDPACIPVDAAGSFVCLPPAGAEARYQGDPCRSEFDCLSSGMAPTGSAICVPAQLLGACDADHCCTTLCDTAAPNPDEPCLVANGESCEAYFEPDAEPAGLESLGICRTL